MAASLCTASESISSYPRSQGGKSGDEGGNGEGVKEGGNNGRQALPHTPGECVDENERGGEGGW